MTDHAKALADALRLAEWAATTLTQSFCPVCGNEKPRGHTSFCELKVALAAYDSSKRDIQEEVLDVCQAGSSRPAEAATRENGAVIAYAVIVDLPTKSENPIRMDGGLLAVSTMGGKKSPQLHIYKDADCWNCFDFERVIPVEIRPISTHQQQGAESELVKAVSFERLGQDVGWATGAGFHDFDGSYYAGHQTVPINFNSLGRIVDKHRREVFDALSRASQPDTVTDTMLLATRDAWNAWTGTPNTPDHWRATLNAALAARGK